MIADLIFSLTQNDIIGALHPQALLAALHAANQRLLQWQANPQTWNQLLLQVFRRSAPIDLSGISIEILDGDTMTGLHGAYAPISPNGTERIYLNADWLTSATPAAIEAVLLEELGHAIDERLNGSSDSAGDEGAIFSALLRGESPDLAADRDNDHRILNIDGVAVAVEASIDTTRPTGSLVRATDPAYTWEGQVRQPGPFGIPRLRSGRTKTSPALVDVDGDGDLDLFIGTYWGRTYFFRNTGSASAPAFRQEFTAPNSTPFGITRVSAISPPVGSWNGGTAHNASALPAFVDIDNDGDLDLFSGVRFGDTAFFRNTAAPGATTPAYTREGGSQPFGVPHVIRDSYRDMASLAFIDIDDDGDFDLFFGTSDENDLFYRNTGSANNPAFSPEGGDTPFGIAANGLVQSPAFADVDNDGDFDLFIGNSQGNTLFYRNTGSASAPAFTQEGGYQPFGINISPHGNPAFADIDDDGDLDLFIGDYWGGYSAIRFFRNTAATPVAPVNATTANGSYGIGAVINLTIGFSEDVIVDTTNGTPTLQLQTGEIDRYATYASGSGTSTLTFQYTVQEGDTSTDLDQLSSTALTLNGGSINDAAGNAAILTLAAPGDTGSLAANADLVIDTEAPTISVAINDGGDGLLNAAEDSSVTISGITTGTEDNQTVSIAISDGSNTINTSATVTSNSYSASSLDLAALIDGTLTITADVRDLAGNSATQASDTTTKDTTPRINAATYNDSTGVLSVTCVNLPAYAGANNDIDVSKLTITGESGGTYTLSSSDVELISATEFVVTLNSTDQTNLDSILNKNGTSSSQGTTYNIAAINRWAPGSDSSVNSADLTGNAVTVANIPNRAPSGSVTISGTAIQGETLTAANTLVDLDGLGSIGYQWNRAGAAITGATSSTYLLGRADVGSAITVTANYTDGEEKAESVTSISATPMVASRVYQLSSSDTVDGIANSGIIVKNKRGKTFSDTSSSRWDVVKAVQDRSNQWKVLLRGDNSYEGKWYYWNVDEAGVITNGSGWKQTADAVNAGWDSIFGNSLSPNTDTSLSVLDVNANGIVDDITNYHLTNGSNSVRLHSTYLQSYSHESSANWDVSKAVEINNAWKVLVKGANSMDGMWSVWDAGVSGTVTQASTWMSTEDSLKEGWEQIFGDVIDVDNVIGIQNQIPDQIPVPIENRNDLNSDGLMDNMVIYHLDNGDNGDGLAIHNSRGNTFSDASTSRWDAVLAVEDNNNDWKVLLQGTGTYDGQWYYWNVDDTGLITSGSGWKSHQGAIADGWDSFFGNGFGNNQLIIEDPGKIGFIPV